MTLHRLIVSTMLAVTTAGAFLYVSTFPAEGEPGLDLVAPALRLESESPPAVPAGSRQPPVERAYDAQARRSLA